MSAVTTMMIDYGDSMYKYTPQGYSVEVRGGNRLLAGGSRVKMYGLEDFRLDLQWWEVKKEETSKDGAWRTLYFRKRQPKMIEIVKEISGELTETFESFGYEEVDGKYYIFTNVMETQVIDGVEWNAKKTRFSYPGYSKDALIFTKKTS